MSYIQGFLVPVPNEKREDYLKMARDAAPMFSEFGAKRIVEAWGDDVPHGKTNDMYGGVKAEDGENVVFSWIDWGDEATCQLAHDKMVEDERMKPPEGGMPFDGMRMVYGGFEPLGEAGSGGETKYVNGYVAPVPRANRAAYDKMAATMRDIAVDCGATRATDSWADKLEDGKVTDFKRTVQAKDDEAVVFGWTEWPSKEAYEKGMAAMRADSRMPGPGSEMPLDGSRIVFGGFEVMLDSRQEG